MKTKFLLIIATCGMLMIGAAASAPRVIGDEASAALWKSQIDVRKKVDADPQRFFYVVESVITEEQAGQIEAALFPAPSPEAVAAEAADIEARLRALVSSGAITPERLVQKAAEIAADGGK